MSHYTPFKVSCTLTTAIACDGHLPLESFLAALWMREHQPDAYWNNSVGAKDDLITAELPLETAGSGENWYYKASFVQAEWQEADIIYWHKRPIVRELVRYLGPESKKLNIAEGGSKAYRMPVFRLMTYTPLVWYAVGDWEWVRDRINLITGLGKKRAYGNGGVTGWLVEPVENDWSISRGERLNRAVPPSDLPKGVTQFFYGGYGLRPPEWYQGNYRQDLLLPVVKTPDISL